MIKMSKKNTKAAITKRVFNYNGMMLPDPGIEQYPTADSVKDYYSASYPELNNAVKKETESNGVLTVNFKQNTGTKG
jgi:PRTRC genetic system protein C